MRKLFIIAILAALIPALCFAGTSNMPALTTETNLLGTHYFWVTDAAGTTDKKAAVSQIFGTDPELSTLAAGISGPVFGLGNGNGFRAATFADIVGLWTPCTTGALQYDGTCVAGGGSVDVSGTPANHYFAVWTDADTVKGVNVGASKVVCTTADGDPVACSNITATQISIESVLVESSDSDPTELGEIKHDNSDTGSTGGGDLKWFDGKNVRTLMDAGTNATIITEEQYLPVRYFEDGAVAPSPADDIGTSGLIARSFTEGDSVVFYWHVPANYYGGLKYQVQYGLSKDATTDETVVFSMTGCGITNSGTIACTAGTALTVSDELGTDDDAADLMISDYSDEASVDWSISAGQLVRIVLSNDASGDFSGEPLIVGVRLKYKATHKGIAGY